MEEKMKERLKERERKYGSSEYDIRASLFG